MPGPSVRDAYNPFLGRPARVKFTVGTQASRTIKVTASLLMANRAAQTPAARQHVRAWLAANNTGTLAPAGAPDGAVAIAAKGQIMVSPTAKVVHDIICDANGEFDLNITNSAAATYYLCVSVGGQVFVSPAIVLT